MQTLKTKSGQVVALPAAEEEKAIQAGIAADPDNPEWSDADFARAQPLREALGDGMAEKLIAMRKPGRPKAAVTKVPVTMRVDAELLEAMRATGAGWQTRAGEALRREFTKTKRGARASASAGPKE